MSAEPPVRIGLRVPDVDAAARLYEALGFAVFARLDAMVVLRRGPLQLLADSLDELPYADAAQEALVKRGPRGLGVVVGLEVDDVDAATGRARAAGCTLTHGPVEAAWGERYSELTDPYGYTWKLFRTRAI
ncbi:VOC family protein [Dactylosporangium sp. CS-033363]|uniref:VOC family protein n=1 Tax=Dactylosporangium sp. CS-033363 TaxID=3239935 RepID=UPI003D8CE99D